MAESTSGGDEEVAARPSVRALASWRVWERSCSVVNGTPYTFQSNLPAFGGYSTGAYPTPGPMTVQVNVSGQVVTPEFVQAQWSSAASASNGRLQDSAIIQQRGLVVS